jgi:5'-deoxynucleotidase
MPAEGGRKGMSGVKQYSFLGWIFRMPMVRRWSLMRCVEQEDIAAHSMQVSVIAHLLAVIRNKRYADTHYHGLLLDPNMAATIGLFHEISETWVGDIVTPVKYSSPELTSAFKRLERQAEYACLKTLPADIRSAYEPLVHQDHTPEPYARLCKAADVLAAYAKVQREIAAGNREFDHVHEVLQRRLTIFKDMPEVVDLLDTMMDACASTLDRLVPAEDRPELAGDFS